MADKLLLLRHSECMFIDTETFYNEITFTSFVHFFSTGLPAIYLLISMNLTFFIYFGYAIVLISFVLVQ